MSLFDPETGKVTDPEALRSIQLQPGGRTVAKSKVVDGNKVEQVLDDQTGKQIAIQTYHGDSDRVDAVVTPPTITAGTQE